MLGSFWLLLRSRLFKVRSIFDCPHPQNKHFPSDHRSTNMLRLFQELRRSRGPNLFVRGHDDYHARGILCLRLG